MQQLRTGTGRMASLATESGEVKLDWVEAIPRLLVDPDGPERIEREAEEIADRGIRYVIWSGMGGSVMAVRVMRDMVEGPDSPVHILPLDSTDPVAADEVLQSLAQWEGVPAEQVREPAILQSVLQKTLMVAVSMGMTSEEPIMHLTWFLDLLAGAGLRESEHALVMTLPGSYLDRFAQDRGLPQRPLQPDGGTGTGGRMSAPGTRVFLLPAALYLRSSQASLRQVLADAWDRFDLELALGDPAQHPYVWLAAGLSDRAAHGVCRVVLALAGGWKPVYPWVEQLMEESLGKQDRGVVLFQDQSVVSAPAGNPPSSLIRLTPKSALAHGIESLADTPLPADIPARLALLAADFLGWELAMSLYGYLQSITFAGQPAVEDYKRRTRELRASGDPLQPLRTWQPRLELGAVTVVGPAGWGPSSRTRSLATLLSFYRLERLQYVDVTWNGELGPALEEGIQERLRATINARFGLPWKFRRAPASYHSTEQSEMDGPQPLVSVRILPVAPEATDPSAFPRDFLEAQAVATWQAMIETGRACYLLVTDTSAPGWDAELLHFFDPEEPSNGGEGDGHD